MDRNDQAFERRIVLEIDGPGVSPETVDAPAVLELAAAFFSLVQGNAAEATEAISLRGLEVIDKCMGIAVPVDHPEAIWPYVEESRHQLLGHKDAPRGLVTIADRGRNALRKLPRGQTARVLLGRHESSLMPDDGTDEPPLDSLLSIRATLLRIGGTTPAARFVSEMEDGPFTLLTTEEQARALGQTLYKEIDIEAKVCRDADGTIIRGRLDQFEQVLEGDPRPAWREWFKYVGGDKWQPEDEGDREE